MRFHKTLGYTLLLVVIALAFLAWNQWSLIQQQKNLLALLKSNPDKNLSVIVQAHAKKAKNFSIKPASIATLSPGKTPLLPSPLDAASEEEQSRFPGASVIDAAEEEGPELGQNTRVRILETDFKYPYVRTEEVVDAATGNVVAREEMVADHLLINLPEGQTPSNFLKSFGPGALSMTRVTPNAPLYCLNLAGSSPEMLPWALDQVIMIGGTLAVSEPDFIHQVALEPDYPVYNNRWGFLKVYDGLNAPNLWNKLSFAKPVLIAMVDSGIRDTHTDLKENIWCNPSPTSGDLHGWNAVADNGDPKDDNGHGTHCAGIIGALGKNNLDIIGISSKVELMACKAFYNHGMGVSMDEIKCIDYAVDHGAEVLSCSWGGNEESPSLVGAINRARSAGVICVAGAGNDGFNNDKHPFYTANSALDNIISVAATTPTDELASFSNYGKKTVHLAAPGVSICSTFADTDSSYACASGTSMAVPYVAATVALIKMQSPLLSYREVIPQLLNATDKVPALDGKVVYGRLNIPKALGL